MNSIDATINKAKARHRIAVTIVVVLGAAIILGYLSWLFLVNGFKVKVLPADAAATQQFRFIEGTGFSRGDSVFLLGTTGVIRVSADKYQAQDLRLDVHGSQVLEVELEPLPATVVLTTEPAHEDMEWWVDSTLVHTGATLSTTFAPGQYQVAAQHPYYQIAQQTMTAEIAGELQQQLTLQPIAGTLQIQTEPAGASVYMEGSLVGQTPLSLPKQGGDYPIEVRLDGYQSVQDTLPVHRSQPTPTRHYLLQPEQGQLRVQAEPSDGALFISGTPRSSPASVDANVEHLVRYEKQGYISATKKLTLAPGEQRAIRFKLEPEIAKVNVTSNIPAEVFVAGKSVGQTPLELSLQTIPTSLEFRKSGYRTVTRNITPNARQTITVSAEMLQEFEARRKEGQPLFVETLGIQMLKLKPTAFTMGSPRNEVGRSPNEHQVQVDFSRSIWVSRHEITEAQFAQFKPGAASSNLPVTQVSWDEAAAYTNWLSEQEGLEPFYVIQNQQVVGFMPQARGYRLPTEAEWEFIAKLANRASPTKYVWGSTDRMREQQGNFSDESRRGQQTFIFKDYQDGYAERAPVGSFSANQAGFYDLDGNVREWVHDFYSVVQPATSGVMMDYTGVAQGTTHVVKGASYLSGRLQELRTAARSSGRQGEADIGFRIARYDD